MKRLIHILLFLALAVSLKAQVYSNEWIDFNNKYYKFKIGKTGFYRIDSTTLANSGVNLGTINPKNFQLFIRGKEIPIYIQGESDNVLNNSDFIEFFAERNDGKFDSALYFNTTYLPNPSQSLFNDTISAFLTWNNLTSNKRIISEIDTAYSAYTPASYFYTDKVFTSRGEYNYVEDNASYSSDPRYTQAEGYGIRLLDGQTFNTGISAINMYSLAALPVEIKINFSGSSVDYSVPKDHNVKGVIYDGTGNPVTLFDTTFKGYRAFSYNFSMTSNTLGNGSNIELSAAPSSVLGVGARNAIHHVYYKYPQFPDLGGATFYKLIVNDDISSTKVYLRLTNASLGPAPSLLFYDVTNGKRIVTTFSAGIAKVLVPNSGNVKTCYIAADANQYVTDVDTLVPVNQTGYFVNYMASPKDSAYVIITHRKLMAKAMDYKVYRESSAGGSHNVILSDIEELTDQFAWGIKHHPLSIKNFCRFLIDSMPGKPRNVFLIGKSVQARDFAESPYVSWSAALLPSQGVPPSDVLFTSGIKTNNYVVPEIPIGHLAAQTATDVTAYLNKVIQHEDPLLPGPEETHDWKKHVLHFCGGNSSGQQTQFKGYLDYYKSIIQDTSYGGRVYDFVKTTTAPIQITLSDSAKNHFNYGVSLVTFFGHGSVTGFDQAIDDPNLYNNAGKYPLFIANSCFTGNIFTRDVISNSEKFVLANQKGSIAFIAASSLGFVGNLFNYTSSLYNSLSYTQYGKSIGEIVQQACINSYNINTNDSLQRFQAMDMCLHGDPAVKISVGGLPDHMINNSSVFFDIKTHLDSIGISVDIRNLGKARKDTMMVRIQRYFPTGDSALILKSMKAPYYRDTFTVYTPIDFTRGFGLNKFKVMVDAYAGIVESKENNNSTTGTVDLFIQGGDIVPVYPYKYAVIPSTPTITLKASTSDPFTSMRNYRMQLDTTDAFTSPLTTTLISSAGGVVEWVVSLPFPDSTVYYWRVTKDSINPQETFVWRESSFQTITNKHGWGQSHFFQFKNDGYQFVKYKRPLRQFAFENDKSSIFCRTGIIYGIHPADIIYSINGSIRHQWNCEWDGWTIAVFDPISAKPLQANATATVPMYAPWGSWLCVDNTQPLYAFDFGGNSPYSPSGHASWQSDLETFINNIPVNSMVLAYSSQKHTSSTFSNGLYSAFENFGSANIRTVKDTTPYIIFGKKGAPIGSANEVIAPNSFTSISLNDTLKSLWNSGYVASELIGPGYKWNSFHWKVRSLDASAGDTTIVKIVGIKSNGVIDTLVTFTEDSLNVTNLGNYADANVYPYLKLIAFKKDNVHRTSPQLKYWYVLFDEAPECAINPKKGFVAINDTLQEGDNVTLVLPIENIGTMPFTDSLVVTYWIEDANRVNNFLPQKMKAKPFNPGAVILDTIKINTYQFPGKNALWVDVNPPQNSKYQKEQYHFNNVARYPFSVSRDITNPLLDVTFDGVRIMNGDVVSAKPHILVNLKDENKFLALNDTNAFRVYLKRPNDLIEQRIYFANGLIFTPAQLPGNSCKIEYDPQLPQDGKHVLIVQATDRSTNVSGAVDYRITFDVINKSTITQVINYPNPFSTSTRFVFNLTGSEVPEMFNIQIMTITGKIVKTIMRDELGPLHIGRNITEYAWDGKDDFGDKLANGVYLYKVQTKLNGQSIEHKTTEADAFFTKELGKMVIMR